MYVSVHWMRRKNTATFTVARNSLTADDDDVGRHRRRRRHRASSGRFVVLAVRTCVCLCANVCVGLHVHAYMCINVHILYILFVNAPPVVVVVASTSSRRGARNVHCSTTAPARNGDQHNTKTAYPGEHTSQTHTNPIVCVCLHKAPAIPTAPRLAGTRNSVPCKARPPPPPTDATLATPAIPWVCCVCCGRNSVRKYLEHGMRCKTHGRRLRCQTPARADTRK